MFPSENPSKLDKSIMDAYLSIHEGVRKGHAAGDTDIAKQASQLASDIKYKAKGKVKPGANKEEIKKVYMALLGGSPAPAPVKVLAKKKLLGEGYDKPDEKLKTDRDGYRVPKKDADEARERLLAKSKKKREEKKEKMDEGFPGVSGKQDPAEKLKLHQTPGGRRYYTGPGGREMDPADVNKVMSGQLMVKKQTPKPTTQVAHFEPEGEQIDEKKMTKGEMKKREEYVKGMKKSKKGFEERYGKRAKDVMYATATKMAMKEGLDPVGQEDKDVDNDGDHDKSDKYLLKRRDAVKKAIAKRRMKEGFSSWRTDLNYFDEAKK